MSEVAVGYEQAVYGSFPFWDRGYAILASSPGCRPEWLTDLRAVCQRYGERPAGGAEAQAFFALPLSSGPWAIIGVGPQGVDDQGRPGALAFHALFLDPRDYRRAGGNPFPFTPLLRNDWTIATQTLSAGTWIAESPEPLHSVDQPRAIRIASALSQGQRIALQAAAPIDDLAREVWQLLPETTRARLSLATWAYGNGNQFDLVALPRLSGITLDASYLDPAALDANPQPKAASSPGIFPRIKGSAYLMSWLGAAVILLGVGFGLVTRQRHVEPSPPVAARPVPSKIEPPSPPASLPPARSAYGNESTTSVERAKVAESLHILSDRFGIPQNETSDTNEDPATLMITLAQHLRYQGPLLTADEQAHLQAEDGPGSKHDRALASKWDTLIRRFVADRPLPPDFASGPLRWQLDTLVWSFHLDDASSSHVRSVVEILHALADSLALDVPVRPIALMKEIPVLQRYFAFLDRLPRR